jgi:Flp pilus assembly pilin Flp
MIARLRHLLHNQHASTAAEFALILPLVTLFIFGMIDVGRYMWTANKSEKATQMGARYAVVTAPVPSGLAAYDYTATLAPGETIPASAYGTMTCGTDTALGDPTCTCVAGGNPCPWGTGVTVASFTAIYERVKAFLPEVSREHVKIDYSPSGLGYAGDPTGPDIYPVVTVRLQDFTFRPISAFSFDLSTPMPDFSYSLTMEDSLGAASN